MAQLGSTFHTWSLASLSRSRAWATSFGRMAVGQSVSFSLYHGHHLKSVRNLPPSTSCLLAKTRSTTLRISRSWMIRPSSDLASSMRARSQESITKMRAWVPGSGVSLFSSQLKSSSKIQCPVKLISSSCQTSKNCRDHVPEK